jgi:hypothetical protein
MVSLAGIRTNIPAKFQRVSSTRLGDGRNHGHRPRTHNSMELTGVEWERIDVGTTSCGACGLETERGAEFCPACLRIAARAVAGDSGAFAELIALRG